jgi:hypothetical protein
VKSSVHGFLILLDGQEGYDRLSPYELEYWGRLQVPSVVKSRLEKSRNGASYRVRIIGSLFSRLLVIYWENDLDGFILGTPGVDVKKHPFVVDVCSTLCAVSPEDNVFYVNLDKLSLEKFFTPHVQLFALCHPETFPLPRFPLGISSIAACIRHNSTGTVTMKDMQLGATIKDLINGVIATRPHIVGISATFGQYDLLIDLLKQILAIPEYDPVLLCGGSLPALVYPQLLEIDSRIIVALGAGEATMRDLIEWWHGNRRIGDVNHIAYRKAWWSNSVRGDSPSRTNEGETADDTAVNLEIAITPGRRDPADTAVIQELDLLEPTLARSGVLQLESSRGCTYYCSFCPREHKGVWFGGDVTNLRATMPHIATIYANHPDIAKKVFLVDEEFFGYSPDADARAVDVATVLHSAGFRFETSARVDQVFRPSKTREWNIQRINTWRELISTGLDRCLFGVESGVDSILKRFNKRTSAQQNVIAGRILSLVGVPVRFTYITFDPLMTMDEICASYLFQGRRDIWLNKGISLSAAEILDAAHDDDYAAANASGSPLYHQIPYMLVSMECLIGSDYLKQVEAANLATDYCLSMGRRNSLYQDARIRLMSVCAQLWIDRNFALDYTLKSLIKITGSGNRRVINAARNVLRDHSYQLLGSMLFLCTGDKTCLLGHPCPEELVDLRKRVVASSPDAWDSMFMTVLDLQFARLVEDWKPHSAGIRLVAQGAAATFTNVHERWMQSRDWRLINTM